MMPQDLSLLVLGVEDQVPGVLGHGHAAQRLLDLLLVDAHGGEAPGPGHEVLVARIDTGDLGHELGVEVGVVGDLAAVDFLVQAAVDLLLAEAGRGHDDVVAGIASHQLGVQGLVVLEGVVVDLDAELLLEVGNHGLGDVVGPVVDVQDLLVIQNRACRGGAAAAVSTRPARRPPALLFCHRPPARPQPSPVRERVFS
jgi:hypothetical protein